MLKKLFTIFFFVLILLSDSNAVVLHNDEEPADRPSNNVMGRWNNSTSCIAIGENWVVSTAHQGGGIGSTVLINNTTYVVNEYFLSEGDMALSHITKLNGENANLTDFVEMSIDSKKFINNQAIIGGYGFGRGAGLYTNDILYGYKWSSEQKLRWGTNIITKIDDYHVRSSFNESGTINECGLSAGDSGGGWFIKKNNKWILIGISRGTEHYGESWFRNKIDPLLEDPDGLDAGNINYVANKFNNIIFQYNNESDIIIHSYFDYYWCYENFPITTQNRNKSILKIEIIKDTLNNKNYNIYVNKSQFSDGECDIAYTANPYVFNIIGIKNGEIILNVIVEGVENGGIGFHELKIKIRKIGDVNNSGYADAEDKLYINQSLNGIETPYTTRELDFNGDRVVNSEDKLIMNQILNGIKLN